MIFPLNLLFCRPNHTCYLSLSSCPIAPAPNRPGSPLLNLLQLVSIFGVWGGPEARCSAPQWCHRCWMEGKGLNFRLHSQAGAGSGGLARSPHHGAVLSSALLSELVAVAAWSSWQSLARPQCCVASLSGSQGFGLPFLQSIAGPTPRGSSPPVNSVGTLGRGKVGRAGGAELEGASMPPGMAGNAHRVVWCMDASLALLPLMVDLFDSG